MSSRSPSRSRATLLAASAASLALAGAARAQGELTVHDGVYGKAQAERGLETFQARCAVCHGPDMRGTAGGPQLVGGLFMLHWAGKPASDVLALMRKTMPPDSPGSLSAEAYLDLLAAIFQANRFPPNEAAPLTEAGAAGALITRKGP